MIAQIAIAFTGVIAIWLTQSKSASMRRFACIFGLSGQPFWFYSAITAEQWGIVVLCCFYTLAWARGVRNNWFPAHPAPAGGGAGDAS